MSNRILQYVDVISSCGNIQCNQDGIVKKIESSDTDSYIFKIKSFNFKECDHFWGEAMDSYDILDLSGEYIDGSSFEADHEWRKSIDLREKKD